MVLPNDINISKFTRSIPFLSSAPFIKGKIAAIPSPAALFRPSGVNQNGLTTKRALFERYQVWLGESRPDTQSQSTVHIYFATYILSLMRT